MQAKLLEGREAVLKMHISEGREFFQQLQATVRSLLQFYDTVLMPVDLGALPGDEDVVPKRKSLRRLRKARHKRKILAGKGQEEEDVKRFRKRVWPPLPLKELSLEIPAALLGDNLPKEIGAGGGDGDGDGDGVDEAAAAAAAVSGKGSKKAGKKSKKEKKDSKKKGSPRSPRGGGGADGVAGGDGSANGLEGDESGSVSGMFIYICLFVCFVYLYLIFVYLFIFNIYLFIYI